MSIEISRELVEDTLFARRMHRDGFSCFTWNKAGIELMQASDSALPIIEDVLQGVVAPAFGLKEFRGLTEVIGAYFVIGTRSNPKRTFEFIRSLPTPLMSDAVLAVGTWFHSAPRPNSIRFLPSAELLQFLEECACCERQSIRWNAQHVLQRLRQVRSPDASRNP